MSDDANRYIGDFERGKAAANEKARLSVLLREQQEKMLALEKELEQRQMASDHPNFGSGQAYVNMQPFGAPLQFGSGLAGQNRESQLRQQQAFGGVSNGVNHRYPEIQNELDNLGNEITAAGECLALLLGKIACIMDMTDPHPQRLAEPVQAHGSGSPATQMGIAIRTHTVSVMDLRRLIEDASRRVML